MRKPLVYLSFILGAAFIGLPILNAHPTLQLGIDVLEQSDFSLLKGKKIGILTHNAARNSHNIPVYEVLYRSPIKDQIVCFLTPEHGLLGQYAAGEHISEQQQWNGIPVFSLYDNQGQPPLLSPTKKQLSNIDVLVIDLVDIGARCYTYITCVRFALEQCIRYGKQVVILDRPNPLGRKVSGPIMDQNLQSYVGGYCIPFLHGMTMGELATMLIHAYQPHPWLQPLTQEQLAAADVKVVKMEHYLPDTLWDQQAWNKPMQWTPTSPNIPTFESALAYSCFPILQIGKYLRTISSAQRKHKDGIPQPFAFLYSPHACHNPYALCETLNAAQVPGITCEVVRNGTTKGIHLKITDWEQFNPGLFVLKLYQADQQLKAICPIPFISYLSLKFWTSTPLAHYNICWVTKRPSVRYDQAFWKIHIGDPDIIKLVESGLPLTEEYIRVQINSWEKTIAKFKQQRKAWLLY